MKRIQIWEDKADNTQQRDSLVDLKTWVDSENISTIFDISNWHSNGRWVGWRHLETPVQLKMDYSLQQSVIQRVTPDPRQYSIL